MPEKNNLRATK